MKGEICMNIEASRSCEFAEKEVFKLKLRHLILITNYRFADPYATRSIPSITYTPASIAFTKVKNPQFLYAQLLMVWRLAETNRPRPSMRLPYEQFFGNLGMYNFPSPQPYCFIPPSADCTLLFLLVNRQFINLLRS